MEVSSLTLTSQPSYSPVTDIFTPQEVELWCMLSHQTSTHKANDPISIIRALKSYQIPFDSLPDWVLDSFGMDSNPRKRNWLRTADNTFANELSDLSRTSYFSWFFSRWEYLMGTLCSSNETVCSFSLLCIITWLTNPFI